MTTRSCLVVLGVASLLVVGCNNLIGLSGYSFVEVPGGSGGTGGSEPGKCELKETAVDRDYAKACALAVGCSSLSGLPFLSRCIDFGLLPRFGSPQCLAAKNDCAGYFGCTGEWLERDEESQCNGWTCEGDVAKRCAPQGGTIRFSCADHGGKCVATKDKFDYPCQVGATVDCSGKTAYQPFCSGSYSVQCSAQGQVLGRSCDDVGVCDSNSGTCTVLDDVCEGEGKLECKEGTLRNCYQGRIQKIDCGLVGLGCEGSAERCLAPGCSGEQALACQESCLDDSRASLCLGGAPWVFDCDSVGMKCIPIIAEGNTYATCR